MKKNICIDARFYGIRDTGIGRYVENLIANLPVSSGCDFSLIVTPADFDNPKLSRFKKYRAYLHPYSVLAQLEMFYLWLKIRPALFHATHSSIPVLWPGRLVVTFHDLIRHISKGRDTTTRNYSFFRLKYLGYLMVDRIALKRAARIIVPSNFWKTEIINRYKIPSSRIAVTYEGVDMPVKNSIESGKYKLVKPYVVYTGNLYPHKNIPVLLQAIKLLNGRVSLVLVGARSVFTQRAKALITKLGVTTNVTLMGRLSDSDLSVLYRDASAFVFPSLIEGFGLTGLEAMSQGLPVIAANSSCLPEIYGNAALYFDPHSPDDLAQKITRVVKDPSLRKQLSSLGFKKVKKYSWAKMAEETCHIYQNALR